ncbi:ZP domain-containing protein [Trichonephila clavipes]|nr:ZP domain-containing protein [Trichonephila clavipes]
MAGNEHVDFLAKKGALVIQRSSIISTFNSLKLFTNMTFNYNLKMEALWRCRRQELGNQEREPVCEGQRHIFSGRPKAPVDSEFQSAKSKVSLSCDTGKMVFKMTFFNPFVGVVQIGPKATRECTLRGDGRRTSYTLTVSPDACGSCKGHTCSPGTFVNSLYIRYHPTLERDGDDVKTVICKYQAGSIQAG